MPRQLPHELIFQVFALLIAFILVHGAYVTVVRPQAAAFVAAGYAKDFKEGVKLGEETIDSGKAKAKLDELIKYTNSL